MVEKVAVTQADREAAADLIAAYWPSDPTMQRLADAYRGGHSNGIWAIAFARHRIATAEACARIAEERHTHWRMPHPDDAKPGEVCDDISACRDIATAIRLQQGSEKP